MSSVLASIPNTPENRPSPYQDEPSSRFIATEQYLDDALRFGHAYEASAIENELLSDIEHKPTIDNQLGRLCMKAIAIAQFARQHEINRPHRKDATYRNLGKVTTKLLANAEESRRHIFHSKEAYVEHRNTIGALSETAMYMLLGYNSTMEHSFSGRKREIPVHYTVPSYYSEDRGYYDSPFDISTPKTGFDFKLFTENKDERVIPLQVKTSTLGIGERGYADSITVVTLDKILPENQKNEILLPTLLAEDAAGHYSTAGKRQINTAVRNLDRLIIDGGVKS